MPSVRAALAAALIAMLALVARGQRRPYRSSEGLVALFTFEGGSLNDVSGYSDFFPDRLPLHLAPVTPSFNVAGLESGIELRPCTADDCSDWSLRSQVALGGEPFQATGELTVEILLRPDNLVQEGPARIVTMSESTSCVDIAFHLGQEETGVSFRVNVDGDTGNGCTWSVPNLLPDPIEQSHIAGVFSTATAEQTLYVDGETLTNDKRPSGISNWDFGTFLTIGNEVGGGRKWDGTIWMLGIYNRALTVGELEDHAQIGDALRPQADPQAFTLQEGGELDFELAIDDPADRMTLGIVFDTIPETGTLTVTSRAQPGDPDPDRVAQTIAAAGATVSTIRVPTITFRPAPQFDGVATFTYRLDAGDIVLDPVTVTLTVENANSPPLALNQTIVTPAATPVTVSFPVTDDESQIDNPVRVELLSDPVFGTLTVPESGDAVPEAPTVLDGFDIVYTPRPGLAGAALEELRFRGTDTILESAVAILQIDVQCPAGRFVNGTNQCEVCPAGRALPEPSTRIDCDICLAGSFGAGDGATECTPCPLGQWQPVPEQAVCLECPAGSASADALTCSPCEPGSFNPVADSQFCSRCGRQEYMPDEGASACLSCPANSEAGFGATSLADCTCMSDFYAVDDECRTCPLGAICDGSSTPTSGPGFWGEVDSETGLVTFVPCEPPESCIGESQCATGYEGRVCAQCRAGFFRLNNTCYKCARESGWVIFVVLVAVLLSVYFFFRIAADVALSGVSGSVSISFAFLQVLAVFGILELAWPQTVRNVFNGVSLVANLSFDLAAPECQVTLTWTSKWAIAMLLPGIYGALFYVTYLAVLGHTHFVAKYGQRLRAALPVPHEAIKAGKITPYVRVRRYLQRSVLRSRSPEEVVWFRRLSVNAFLTFLSLAYTFLCATVLKPFACISLNEVSVVADNPAMACSSSDPEYLVVLPLAVMGLFLYVFGIPAAFVYLLVTAARARRLREPEVVSKLGYIYLRYRERTFFWEILVMARKLLIVVAAVNIQNQLSQIILAEFTLLAASMLQLLIKPYASLLNNILEATLLAASLVLLFLGLLFQAGPSLGLSSTSATVLEGIAIVILSFCFLLIIGMVAVEQLRRFRSTEDKERELARRAKSHPLMRAAKAFFSADGLGTLAAWLGDADTSETDIAAVQDSVRRLELFQAKRDPAFTPKLPSQRHHLFARKSGSFEASSVEMDDRALL